jgi:LysM repeat protein
VRQGDTLWGIAEKLLGHGWDYPRLLSANPGLTANIKAGQIIRIPGAQVEDNTVTFTVTVRRSTYAALSAKANTKGCTIGEILDKENY